METLPAVVGYAIMISTAKHMGAVVGRDPHAPGNGKWSSGRDDLAERRGDGVSARAVADWCLGASAGGGGNANEGDDTCDDEMHWDRLVVG